jgi:hypothetical protein
VGLFKNQAEKKYLGDHASHFGDAGGAFSLDDGFGTALLAKMQHSSNQVSKRKGAGCSISSKMLRRNDTTKCTF